MSTNNDTATGLDETKIYKLKKQTIHSDFDYATLDDIDGSTNEILKGKSIQSLFEPVRGEYTYFQCIATFKGSAYNGDEAPLLRNFHDILIIKTDEHNTIIDTYQYTLEWAEPPRQYDIYRSSVQGLTLTDGMDISTLKFVRADYGSIDNNLLQETGIIQIAK